MRRAPPLGLVALALLAAGLLLEVGRDRGGHFPIERIFAAPLLLGLGGALAFLAVAAIVSALLGRGSGEEDV